jgi:hypothetical protein
MRRAAPRPPTAPDRPAWEGAFVAECRTRTASVSSRARAVAGTPLAYAGGPGGRRQTVSGTQPGNRRHRSCNPCSQSRHSGATARGGGSVTAVSRGHPPPLGAGSGEGERLSRRTAPRRDRSAKFTPRRVHLHAVRRLRCNVPPCLRSLPWPSPSWPVPPWRSRLHRRRHHHRHRLLRCRPYR